MKKNKNVQQEDQSKQKKELKKLRKENQRQRMWKEEIVSRSNLKLAKL